MQRQFETAEIRPRAIVVMGVSGSGKSTLGALLAETLGCPFLEGDSFHDAASIAKMRAGQPLVDADRWPWLDRLGRAMSEGVAAHGLAVTACSALKRSYRDRLRGTAGAAVSFLLLDADREELARRLANRPGHYMPVSLLESQLEALERPDADEPVLTLDTLPPPAALVETALDWLRQPQSVGRVPLSFRS